MISIDPPERGRSSCEKVLHSSLAHTLESSSASVHISPEELTQDSSLHYIRVCKERSSLSISRGIACMVLKKVQLPSTGCLVLEEDCLSAAGTTAGFLLSIFVVKPVEIIRKSSYLLL